MQFSACRRWHVCMVCLLWLQRFWVLVWWYSFLKWLPRICRIWKIFQFAVSLVFRSESILQVWRHWLVNSSSFKGVHSSWTRFGPSSVGVSRVVRVSVALVCPSVVQFSRLSYFRTQLCNLRVSRFDIRNIICWLGWLLEHRLIGTYIGTVGTLFVLPCSLFTVISFGVRV